MLKMLEFKELPTKFKREYFALHFAAAEEQ
jgi:hypothetical protein